jgi:peptidoglycan biosynthesis protein MviN/MurJ (putative lipid II flippase)
MLLPLLLGLCAAPAEAATDGAFDHEAMMQLMRTGLGTALAVSLVHTAAMIASGQGIAWLVYRYFGLQALRATWFDLDRVWAIGLIVSGIAANGLSPH